MIASIPRALSLTGLADLPEAPIGSSPRRAIQWAAELGFAAIQIDGLVLRARDLDRSARRDIAALLRRLGTALSGIDLWLPPRAFTQSDTIERASETVLSAGEFAVELVRLAGGGRPIISLSLPAALDSLRARLRDGAALAGFRIADHTWPLFPATHDGPIGTGIDPAAIIFAGTDPVQATAGVRPAPISARLCDISASGRVPIGSAEGKLDARAYEATLSAIGYSGPIVVDLRGLPDQAAGALVALRV